MAYYSFIRVQQVYTTNVQISEFFCINMLIAVSFACQYADNNVIGSPIWDNGCFKLLFQKLKGHKTGRPCTIRGPGTNWKSVFYGKLTRTTIPKILFVSPLTTKEHPYKVKKKLYLQGPFFIINEKSIFDFFINYEKTAILAFLFHLQDSVFFGIVIFGLFANYIIILQ